LNIERTLIVLTIVIHTGKRPHLVFERALTQGFFKFISQLDDFYSYKYTISFNYTYSIFKVLSVIAF